MFGIFGSQENKKIKARLATCEKLEKLYKFNKLKLRDQAVKDLKSRHSDIEVVANSQSETIFGYSPSSKAFYSGQVFDSIFDNPSGLADKIKLDNFEKEAERALVNLASPPRQYDPQNRDYQAHGYAFFVESCHPEDVTISKNDKVIGRSNFRYPKERGYFRRILRNCILDDTAGSSSGVSTIELRIEHLFFSGSAFSKLHYCYADTPRKISQQNESYLKEVMSLFLPFLDLVEEELIDPQEDLIKYCSKPSEYDLDDTKLGLPPNKHRNPSRVYGRKDSGT